MNDDQIVEEIFMRRRKQYIAGTLVVTHSEFAGNREGLRDHQGGLPHVLQWLAECFAQRDRV